ncbi:hypothetical protein J1N35_014074 [Gossypium stocksii]|uniref:Secretory carrier-associated membrane protein n=1 Tax=Gossypium stocksii TaxID=47602 RepID=A0A9D3VUW8_9ROSI|nr:hypothetical protein J1N35_014074 [Gossypium stocksii]
MARARVVLEEKNWPPFFPIIHHDIANKIPIHLQRLQYVAFSTYVEKLKDKKAEYEAMASSDSFVNLDDIDNRVITKVLGPESYGWVRFQGFFISPTQYFGSISQQYKPSANLAQAKVQRLRD